MKTIFNGENKYTLIYLFKLIFRTNHSRSKKRLINLISYYHSNNFNITFSTAGRCSLFKILESINLKKNYKVGLQAFTCSVVPKAIIDAGGSPIFIDLEKDTLSMDLKLLEEKIQELDIIILQYTFGITPKYIKEITALCTKKSKILILDKAHCIPEELGKEIYDIESSAFGIFYSTDHTKSINTVRGGIGLSKNQLEPSSKLLPNRSIVFPFLYESICYQESLYVFAQISSIIMRIFSINYMPADNCDITQLSKEAFPSIWHTLVLDQLKNGKKRSLSIHDFSLKIKDLIIGWDECSYILPKENFTTPLRIPLIFKNKELKKEFIKGLKEENIRISDWFGGVLTCSKTEYHYFNYKFGKCPIAENMSERVVGIPCNKRFRDINCLTKIYKVIKKIKYNHQIVLPPSMTKL